MQQIPCVGNMACARDVVDLQCCKAKVAPRGLGSSAVEGAPRLTQDVEQATDVQMAGVQMADAQGDPQSPSIRVACRAALQVVPTASLAMVAAPIEVESGQPMQTDLATPRAGQAEPQDSAEAPDPTAVVTWFEERLLELATSLPAVRTIRHQPRGLRQRTCTILKKLLQHHTHCHHQWAKRRDSESLQAEVAAARWAWLGPTLLVRAYEGSEHADGEELTPGMRRKLSIELVGERATLEETGAWTELLRMYVRDLLSRSYGRRPRLHHLIVVPRNQSQGSKCRSHAHESFAQFRWRRCI